MKESGNGSMFIISVAENVNTLIANFFVIFIALLLLYDVTNKTSFDNIRAWLGEIREYAQDDVVIMLLGKKVLLFYIEYLALISHIKGILIFTI